jgi:hypothetical protein
MRNPVVSCRTKETAKHAKAMWGRMMAHDGMRSARNCCLCLPPGWCKFRTCLCLHTLRSLFFFAWAEKA